MNTVNELYGTIDDTFTGGPLDDYPSDSLSLSSEDRPLGEATEPCRRAWYFGTAPAPTEESPDRDPDEVLDELLQIPLVRTAVDLMSFLGDGRKVKVNGTLYANDQRAFEQRDGRKPYRVWDPDDEDRVADVPLQQIWNLLLHAGWIIRDDRQVRAASENLRGERFDPHAHGFVDACRDLIADVIEREASTWPQHMRENVLLTGLLIATGPDGLIVPWHPYAGRFDHCCDVESFLIDLVRHPHIRDVPIDWRRHVHPDPEIFSGLEELESSLGRLSFAGVLVSRNLDYDGRPHGPYRAPLVVRGGVAVVRERQRRSD